MRKFLLSIAALLIAGAASAQPIGVRVTKDTTSSRLLVRADNGEWLGVWGSGAPSFTTFLGENVPAGAIYFNTATGTPYRFSSGSWAASSGGSAAAITPGTTTATGCTSAFLIADASSLVNCSAAFLLDASGAGNGVFTLRKTTATAVTDNTGFFNFQGTLTTPVSGSVIDGMAFWVAGAGSGNVIQRGADYRLQAGYTGTASTEGLRALNQSAGTGTAYLNFDGSSASANYGLIGRFSATTTGTGVGVLGNASGGDIGIGGVFTATDNKSNGVRVGVVGLASQTTATPTTVGGYFGIRTTAPTFVSSVLQLDNAAIAVPILVAQDNGTTVVQIRDGGSVGGKDAVNGTDSDTAGGNLVIGSGLGTGTGAGGDLKLQRSPSIATGTTIQTASDAYYIRSQMKALSAGAATPFARINLAQGVAGITGWTGGTVFYTLVANDAAEYQSRSGTINFTLVNKGGTETCAVGTVTNEPVANSSGTTTLTFDTDTTGPTNGCDLRATGASSLSETTLALFYSVVLNGPGTVTPQ